MVWDRKQIEQHKKAAKILNKIKNSSFNFIKKNEDVTEYDVQQFILEKFEKWGLKNEDYVPIVAFKENTGIMHYFPNKKSKRISGDGLILIDLWGRLDEKKAPYADITWMGYKGKKVPKNIRDAFDLVKKSRNRGLSFLSEREVPSGKEVSDEGHGIIIEKGYKKNLLHSFGHCLGTKSCHGNGGHLKAKNKNELKKNLGYTIEPGVYFRGKFGVRSEIDFYINSKGNVVVTTPIQKKIILL
tara:strand:+ start:435 stop:1160 length:726 start_codon:yes stop_codon:yes gene_type:complete